MNEKKAMVRLAPIFAVVAGIFWGSEGSFVRVLTSYGMNNITILGTRLGGAVIVLFFIILFTNRSKMKINPRDIFLFICIGGLGSVALNFCYNEAINRMTLSLAAVLLDLCPVYMIIIAFFAFHEKITGRKVLCLLLSLAGVILLSGLGTSKPVWTKLGLLFGILSGIFYASYGLLSKAATNKGYTSTTLNFYSLLFGALICAPFTDWKTTGAIISSFGAKAVVVMIFNSLCCSLFPYLLFASALQYIDAGKAGILALGEPVAAMILGLLLFNEIPTILMLLGMVVIIIALVIMNMPDKNAIAEGASPEEISGSSIKTADLGRNDSQDNREK
ncbi:MAG: DMT family transporter [Eubacteriales bacterium]|nr:DMT family transporter [Eubacteriales bacterium]